MKQVVIGVLAGMGPRTTSPFLEAVLDACTRQYGAKFDGDFPDIVLYSLPTPFHPDRPPDRAALVQALSRGARALQRAGASFMVMPCNTAHLFPEAFAAVDVPLLHIVEATLASIDYDPAQPIAVLATRPIRKSGLYHQALDERQVPWIEPAGLQRGVDRLIGAFKRGGTDEQTLRLWDEMRAALVAAGVRQVVLGCTDLGFCKEHGGGEALRFVDSSLALAEATVREYCRRSGRALHGGSKKV